MPWSVKGIAPEAREAAKAAAHASGMSVGEWLDHAIHEISSTSAAAQAQSQDHPQAQGSGDLAAMETALERIMEHIEFSDRRNAEALDDLRARLGEMSKTAAAAPEPQTRANSQALGRIEQQLSRLSQAASATSPETDEDFEMLGRRLQELRKQARPAPAPASADPSDTADAGAEPKAAPRVIQLSRGADAGALEKRLNALAGEVRSLRLEGNGRDELERLRGEVGKLAGALGQESRAAQSGPLKAMEQSLAELARRLEASLTAQTRLSPQLAELASRVDAIAASLDTLSASGAGKDQAHAALSRQIEALSSRIAHAEKRYGGVEEIERTVAGLFKAVEESRAEAQAQAQAQEKDPSLRQEILSDLQRSLDGVEGSVAKAAEHSRTRIEDMNSTLEGIITRLASLEEDANPPQPAEPRRFITPLAQSPEPPLKTEAEFEPERAPEHEPEPERKIEPAFGPEPEPAPDMKPARGDDKAQVEVARGEDFIAAARRAARAAAQAPRDDGRVPAYEAPEEDAAKSRFSLPGRGKPKMAPPPAMAKPAAPDTARHPRAAMGEKPGASRRRPLLIAAAILLMIGVYSSYSLMRGPDTPETAKFTAPETPAATPAATMPADATSEPGAAAPQMPPDETPREAAPPAAPPDTSAAEAPGKVSSRRDPITGLPALPPEDDASAPEKAPMLPGATSMVTGSIPPDAPFAVSPPGRPTAKADPQVNPGKSDPAGPLDTAGVQNPFPPGFNVDLGGGGKKPAPATGALPPARATQAPVALARAVSPPAAETGYTAPLPPAEIGPSALREAAARGDEKAQYEVANRYISGDGGSVDYRQAAFWYQKAAASGLAPAQYRLGTLYEKGRGVAPDRAAARIWYERAAEKGNRKAMHNLAVLLADGDGKPDFAKAAAWFRRAADHGVHDSQFNLAILHERGLGVQKNDVEAYKWYALASAQGDRDAEARRAALAEIMPANDLAKAKRAVQSWQTAPLIAAANSLGPVPRGWQKTATGSTAGNDMTAEVQKRLNDLGYEAGPADGIIGARTREAIRNFQEQSGLPADGEVSRELYDALVKNAG